jgi:glycosyltransferase involved in cell wall biosynthesis
MVCRGRKTWCTARARCYIPTTKAAQVVTIHDLDFLRHPDQMSAEIRRDYPALARSHAVRAHGVIVSSNYAAGEVTRELQLDPSRVHVCPPGRPAWADEVCRRRGELGVRGKHILFMGTLSLRKNVGTLLEAYARLCTQTLTRRPWCSRATAHRRRRAGKSAPNNHLSRAA